MNVSDYRDTFRLLFAFAQTRLGRSPSQLTLRDLDAPFIGAFLEDLETKRAASVRTRNLRLTAIRSFFRYAAFEEPAYSAHIQRVLAIPSKRCDKRQLQFLTRPEIEAILDCTDRSTWLGRRDYTLLLLAAQTGLRVSEIVDLDRDAVMLGRGAYVQCIGKGRKERSTPLTKIAQQALRCWLKEPRKRGATALFPNKHGGRLSADSVQALLNKYVAKARQHCVSLRSKRVAELATLRLLDLKDDLENGDSSIAQTLLKVTQETEMRNFIGHELRQKAAGRYSIPQEEELADAKRPDLRFHGVGFDGPVPGELKLADKWSGPDLFERLENQLCSDYLRDNRSNRGLFVLVYMGEKGGWDIPSSANRVDFEGLVAALQTFWEKIAPKFPNIDDITVVGIDLTKRKAR